MTSTSIASSRLTSTSDLILWYLPTTNRYILANVRFKIPLLGVAPDQKGITSIDNYQTDPKFGKWKSFPFLKPFSLEDYKLSDKEHIAYLLLLEKRIQLFKKIMNLLKKDILTDQMKQIIINKLNL